MSVIKAFLAMILFCGMISCKDDYDDGELYIFRGECIGGIMQRSSTDGLECRYIPIHDKDNNFVRCE